jgi:hypothetical protein
MRMVSIFFATILPALCLTACPGDDSGSNDTDATTSTGGDSTNEPCMPGASRSCDCAGTPGTQECNGAGTGYGPCLCTLPTTTTPMTTTVTPDDDGMNDGTTDGTTTGGSATGGSTDGGPMTTGPMTDGGSTTDPGTTGGSSSTGPA